MAANNPVQIFRSIVASNVPSLGTGATKNNIGYNAVDGLMYWLDSNLVIQSFDMKAVGVPGLVLLATATASASPTVDFTSFIDATYDHYIFEGVNIILAADNNSFDARLSTDGGITYIAAASSYSWANQGINTAATQSIRTSVNTAITTKIQLINSDGVSSVPSSGLNFILNLWQPSNAATKTRTAGNSDYHDITNDRPVSVITSGQLDAASAVNAVRFFATIGNITSGEFKLYGVKK